MVATSPRFSACCLLSFAIVLVLGSSPAAATLTGTTLGACFSDYPQCVIDSTPGVNESTSTLDTAMAIVGAGVEFTGTAGLSTLDWTADFDDHATLPNTGTLELKITNTGVVAADTSDSKWGWVFTGFDQDIASVSSLGGTLPTTIELLGPRTLGFDFVAPFSIPAVSPGSISTNFQINLVPEPSTSVLVASGLVVMGARRRRKF